MNWQLSVEKTVAGLGYELVDCERGSQGLLRVFIDRIAGQAYPGGAGEMVTVEDCEIVTRQLQRVLDVEGLDYSRLEVSSPGVDRPLRRPEHWQRFAGEQVDVSLKLPFEGRKKYRGLLRAGEDGRFELVFKDGKDDKVLGFALDEVQEARLVPVLDFKGRKARERAGQGSAEAALAGPDNGGLEQ
jgi:ribosome maturation factor RimP